MLKYICLAIALALGCVSGRLLRSRRTTGKVVLFLSMLAIPIIEIWQRIGWYSWACYLSVVLGLILSGSFAGHCWQKESLFVIMGLLVVPLSWRWVFSYDLANGDVIRDISRLSADITRESILFVPMRALCLYLLTVCAANVAGLRVLRRKQCIDYLTLTGILMFGSIIEIGYTLSRWVSHGDFTIWFLTFLDLSSGLVLVWSHAAALVLLFVLIDKDGNQMAVYG